MRTYLIEPQRLFVPFLTRVLTEAGLSVIACKDDLDLKDIATHAPALVFVDVDFFDRGASNAICRIKGVAKDAIVVAFSDSEDATFEAACYISGASAVLSKRAGADAILRAVRSVVPAAQLRALRPTGVA